MEQLEDLGDTEDHAAKRKKPMKTKLSQQVRCVQMNEKLHQPQLRAVRALLTGKNILWVHEEDVSWLLTYISDELATGDGGPIDDADGAMDDDQGLNLDGAAVAAHSEDHPVTPSQGEEPCRQDPLGFQRCMGCRHLARSAKGKYSFMQSHERNSREFGGSIQGAQVHGGL
jgi:hypothetical protein